MNSGGRRRRILRRRATISRETRGGHIRILDTPHTPSPPVCTLSLESRTLSKTDSQNVLYFLIDSMLRLQPITPTATISSGRLADNLSRSRNNRKSAQGKFQ